MKSTTRCLATKKNLKNWPLIFPLQKLGTQIPPVKMFNNLKASKSTFEIITSLRTHATVLEAEIEEICKDLRINRTMGKKYGLDAFKEGETRLMRLRDEKKHNLQLDKLQQSITLSRSLAETLASNQYAVPVEGSAENLDYETDDLASAIVTSPKQQQQQQAQPPLVVETEQQQQQQQTFSTPVKQGKQQQHFVFKSSPSSSTTSSKQQQQRASPVSSNTVTTTIITNSPILAHASRNSQFTITPLQ